MRIFIGIPLEDTATAKLVRAASRLSLPEKNFHLTRPADWHITLQFLGNVTEAQLNCLLPRLAGIFVPPVRIRMAEIDRLGSGIVAAHVEQTPGLARLREEVADATQSCGFKPEDRPWRPHITLARLKSKRRATLTHLRQLLESHAARKSSEMKNEFLAREFLLYESFLGTPGPRYEVRARFPLHKPA